MIYILCKLCCLDRGIHASNNILGLLLTPCIGEEIQACFKTSKICEHIIEYHTIGLYLDDKYKENMLYFDTRVIFNDN